MIGEQKTSVGILGASMATRNRGVSALGSSLVKLLDGAYPGSDMVMLIANRDSKPFKVLVRGERREVRVVNCRQSPRARLNENILVITFLALAYRALPLRGVRGAICRMCPWIRTVAEAALVGDIRGGDSFSDIYGLKNFILASLPPLTVIWIRGSIVLFPQTYGPYSHWAARAVAKYILRRASPVLSRDREGTQMVRSLIGPSAKIQFCPDVAFALDPVLPESISISPPLPPRPGFQLVGVNVNGLMFNGGYTRRNMFGLKLNYGEFLELLVNSLLDDESVRVLLVPHTFAPIGDVESDPEACRLVMEKITGKKRERVHLVDREYDQHEIKGVIGTCDFFIGSRLHSCIAALSQGIPTVGVAYSKKFEGVFETVGAGSWVIDGRSLNASEAVEGVLSRKGQSLAMRETLALGTARVRALLGETFSQLPVSMGPSAISDAPKPLSH